MSYPTPQQLWSTGNRPSFSPDGGLIVFGDGSRLWTIASPVLPPPPILPPPAFPAEPLTPAGIVAASRPDWSWSPDWIAFTGQGDGPGFYQWIVSPTEPDTGIYKLNVVDASTGDPYGQINYPSWYQSLAMLAAVNYTASVHGPQPVILVIDLTGYTPGSTDPVPATAVTDVSQVYAGRPSVSPDGTAIAFAGNQGAFSQQDNQIWIVEPGGAPWQLDPGQGRSPNWSPDGNWITFESNRGGDGYQVFVVPATGGTPEPLTDPSYDANHPEWSRDQTRIAFDSVGGGIYTIDVPSQYRP